MPNVNPVAIADNGRRIPLKERGYDISSIKNFLFPDISSYSPLSSFISHETTYNNSSVRPLKDYIERHSRTPDFKVYYASEEIKNIFTSDTENSIRYSYSLNTIDTLNIFCKTNNLYASNSYVKILDNDAEIKTFVFDEAPSNLLYEKKGTIYWENPSYVDKKHLFFEDNSPESLQYLDTYNQEFNDFKKQTFPLDILHPNARIQIQMPPKKELVRLLELNGSVSFTALIINPRLQSEQDKPVSFSGVPYGNKIIHNRSHNLSTKYKLFIQLVRNSVTGLVQTDFKFLNHCTLDPYEYCSHHAYLEEILPRLGQFMMPIPTVLKDPVNNLSSNSGVTRSRGITVNDIYVPVKYSRLNGFEVKTLDDGTSYIEYINHSNHARVHHLVGASEYDLSYIAGESLIPENLLDFKRNDSLNTSIKKIHRLFSFTRLNFNIISPIHHLSELVERGIPVSVRPTFKDLNYTDNIVERVVNYNDRNQEARVLFKKTDNTYSVTFNDVLNQIIAGIANNIGDDFGFIKNIFVNNFLSVFNTKEAEPYSVSSFVFASRLRDFEESYGFISGVFDNEDTYYQAIQFVKENKNIVPEDIDRAINSMLEWQSASDGLSIRTIKHEAIERHENRSNYIRGHELIVLNRNFESWLESNTEAANSIKNLEVERSRIWENKDSPLSDDKDELFAKYLSWKSLTRNNTENKNLLPFKKETMMDNLSNNNELGKLRFGIEIEFDVANQTDKDEVCSAIGNALYEAQLTSTRTKGRYHAAARSGWQEWSLEHDSTVAGEVVSPIMVDTPETWAEIEKVLDIIKENGGIASFRTGCHVNVSSSILAISTAKRAELLRLSYHYRDILYRLASNPYTGIHRGTKWCNIINDNNVSKISSSLNHGLHGLRVNNADYSSHSVGLNMRAVGSNLSTSRVEFRFWDGTLDASVIQRQVMISIALIDAAVYNVNKNSGSEARSYIGLPLGSGSFKDYSTMKENFMVEPSEEIFMSETDDFVSFLDEIFVDNEKKLYVSDLFFNTKWQSTQINAMQN